MRYLQNSNDKTVCEQNSIIALSTTTTYTFYIREKQSSCGHALEYLESTGTKYFMNGLIVCKLFEGRKKKIETQRHR